MSKRITYANVTATLALVLAMCGGAVAASHYVINSTKQINPKVLKKLKGATGKTGATGAAGAAGAAGAPGKEGPIGPSNGYQAFKDNLGVLPSTTETVGTLAVPAGSYLVTAKLWYENEGSERGRVDCSLVNDVNGDSDHTTTTADPLGGKYFGRPAVVLEAATTMASAGHWLVMCSSDQKSEGHNLKIQAIRVGTLSNTNA